MPLLHRIATVLSRFDADPALATTTFHLAFNAVLAIACIGLLGPAGVLLTQFLPEKFKPALEPTRPLFLDADALDTPYIALANAAREILRMGDLVEMLLRMAAGSLERQEKTAAMRAGRAGSDLDLLSDAVKGYLGRLDQASLTERDQTRLSDLIEFAVNLGHAGDILGRSLAQAATRQGRSIGEADLAALMVFQTRVLADLRLALSTMMTEDERSARELVDAKRELNGLERAAVRDHLARLGSSGSMEPSSSPLFLGMLRDLRSVNSHITSIGYAVSSSRERTDTETAPERSSPIVEG